MSVDYYVQAIVRGGENHARMVRILRDCEAARVRVPESVITYFGGADIAHADERGMVKCLATMHEQRVGVTLIKEDSQDGFVVELAKLPEGTTHVKFIVAF